MSSPPQNLIQKIMIEDINTLTFDSFIQTIKTIKVYRSNANKEYKVVKVNKTTLVLRDQRTKADFEVPATQVFCAMQDFGIENCTVPKMRTSLCRSYFLGFRARKDSCTTQKASRFDVQNNKRTAKREIVFSLFIPHIPHVFSF